MRLTSSRAYTRPTPVPKMPTGLVELMEGLTREVLKRNPSNVYEFCANHMEKLLEIRDGPSSKKSLTLEQKILKAQEKVRQKAKERQERYDKEIRLLSSQLQDEDSTTIGKPNEIKHFELIQRDTVNPILKVPVHHENDLKHASEVEISHHRVKAPSSSTSDVNESSNIGNTLVTASVVGFQKVSADIVSDGNSDVESVSEKNLGQIISLEKPQTNENISVEEHIQSQLQTISEENSVCDSLITVDPQMLPKETDHDFCTSGDVTKESVQFIQTNENTVGIGSDKNNDVKKIYEGIIEGDLSALDGKNIETINEEIGTCSDVNNIVFDSNNVKKDSSDKKITEPLIDNDNQQSDVEPNKISEVADVVIISANDIDEDSETNNIQNAIQEENIIDHSDTSTDAITILDNSEAITPLIDEIAKDEMPLNNEDEEKDLNIKQVHDVVSVDKKLKEDKIDTSKNTTTVECISTSENETSSESKIEDNVSNPNIDSIDLNDAAKDPQNYDIIKIGIAENQDKTDITEDENEKFYDNREVESVLCDSDGKENTNEEIVFVDSDISKTDNKVTQNNSNMDLETAAITIQKVFRTFMFKSRNSTFDDATNDEQNSLDEDNEKKEEYYAAANLTKERRPLGITRMDTVLQTVNEEKSLSLSTDDSSTLSSAATTIQAHVRGFLVRNRLNSNKTISTNSLVNSHEVLESDSEQQKNKTILNIHIVPEEGNYLSRDESLITSMDLSMDLSPPSSINLHPLSYDISERRKMLKREDAIQSISPPSNNSGKLSEDSVKEVLINDDIILEGDSTYDKINEVADPSKVHDNDIISSNSTVTPITVIHVSKSEEPLSSPREYTETVQRRGRSFTRTSSDESDVITPYVQSPRTSENASKLVNSGEFHDVVLPTKVLRNDTSVVRGE